MALPVRAVQERIYELNCATGVPAPFVLEAYFLSSDPQADEKEIHSKVSDQRTQGKEFFRVAIAEALKVSQAVCDRPPEFLNSAISVESTQQTVSEPWKSSLREKLRHAARVEAEQRLERLLAKNERLRQQTRMRNDERK